MLCFNQFEPEYIVQNEHTGAVPLAYSFSCDLLESDYGWTFWCIIVSLFFRMLAKQVARPLAQAVRAHGHSAAPVKFTGPQVPSSFVQDGWATAVSVFFSFAFWFTCSTRSDLLVSSLITSFICRTSLFVKQYETNLNLKLECVRILFGLYVVASHPFKVTLISFFQRLPFHVTNKWMFATKAVAFLAIGFWAPFGIVEYQLRKANSN